MLVVEVLLLSLDHGSRMRVLRERVQEPLFVLGAEMPPCSYSSEGAIHLDDGWRLTPSRSVHAEAPAHAVWLRMCFALAELMLSLG